MKVRNGFVSNSSSSSFIICGVDATNADMKAVYATLGIELDQDDINTIENDNTWEWPRLHGFDFHQDEWSQDLIIGVSKDPECMSVDDCVVGFVSKEKLELLTKLSTELNLPFTTRGGTEYC